MRDADNTLLSGNRRCEVIVQQGLGDMIIDVRTAVRKLTDEELREVMIIENTHAGEWDLEMLKQEFDQLVDLDSYGISHEELDRADQRKPANCWKKNPNCRWWRSSRKSTTRS